MSEKTSSLKLIPVMLAFFAMGFVDLVGIASNYLKADLGLSDSEANIFPSLPGKPLAIDGVLLVLDLLRPDGDVDEPYRAEEDRVIELDRNVSFANDPDLRRRIYGHVDILLPVGYRQRFDADFLEPVIIEYRKRG